MADGDDDGGGSSSSDNEFGYITLYEFYIFY